MIMPHALSAVLMGTVPSWVRQQYGIAGLNPDFALDLPNGLAYVRNAYSGPLEGLLSETNSSGGYVADLAGAYSLVPANTLRRSNKYALFEEARTNSCKNNTMQGASVIGSLLPTNWTGVGTGLTYTVIGLGVENNINYIDVRISGTTGSTSGAIRFEGSTEVSAASGQTWAGSFYLAVVGGSTANFQSLGVSVQGLNNVAGITADNSSTNVLPLTTTALSETSRITKILTLADATTTNLRHQLNMGYNSGVSIDITVRMGLPQLEQGASVTSPIRTTGASATRTADAFSALILPFDFTNTLAVEAIPETPNFYPNTAAMLSLSSGAAANRCDLFRNTDGGIRNALTIGSVSIQTLTGAIVSKDARLRQIVRTERGNRAQSVNGAAVQTGATDYTPASMTQLLVGSRVGGSYLNGGVTKVAGWFSTGLSNAAMQAWAGQ